MIHYSFNCLIELILLFLFFLNNSEWYLYLYCAGTVFRFSIARKINILFFCWATEASNRLLIKIIPISVES